MGTAEISVIASGLVAIATITGSELRHRASLRHSRKLADLDHVRSVLDEAAVVLHQLEYTLNEIRVELIGHGMSFFASDDGPRLFDEFTHSGVCLDELLERLKIRLGPQNEVVAALTTVAQAAVAIHQSLKLIKLEEMPTRTDKAAMEEVRAFFSEQRSQIAAERKKFDSARLVFIERAHGVAGTDLS